MKCLIFRCNKPSTPAPKPKAGVLQPPALELCAEHQVRYRKEYSKHFVPIVSRLARRWLVRNGIAQNRVAAVLEELKSDDRLRSWQATWLQQIDLELLNAGVGGQKGEWKTIDGQEVFVLEGQEPRPSAPSSVPSYAKPPLPEHATRAGQAAIQKRAAEEASLEQKLQAEVSEFARGQRAVLTQELKTKREVELRAAMKRKEKP